MNYGLLERVILVVGVSAGIIFAVKGRKRKNLNNISRSLLHLGTIFLVIATLLLFWHPTTWNLEYFLSNILLKDEYTFTYHRKFFVISYCSLFVGGLLLIVDKRNKKTDGE